MSAKWKLRCFLKCVHFTLGTREGTAVIKSQRDCRLSLCLGDAVVENTVAHSPGCSWHTQQSRASEYSRAGSEWAGVSDYSNHYWVRGLKLEGPGVRGVFPPVALHWLDSLFSKSVLFEFNRINYVTMYLNMECFIKFIHNMYPTSAEFDHETWRSCMECHYSLLILRTFWSPASQETFFKYPKLHSPAC